MFDLIIIGGGAAGFFAAAQVIEARPLARLLILEKTGKVLSKVRISGGGRCNVTHNCLDTGKLISFYPRGNPWLAPAFRQFSVPDTLAWFANQNTPIVAERDGRMFPESNKSETIIDVLTKATLAKGVTLKLNARVDSIKKKETSYTVHLSDSTELESKTVLIATGGFPSPSGYNFLSSLNHRISQPVPSLFTFNVRNHAWADLQGISVPAARVRIDGTDWAFEGPVLVTHWGFSGPAILKCSAFAARYLNENQYNYTFSIDWLPQISKREAEEKIGVYQLHNPKRKPNQSPIFELPTRLWAKICEESGLSGYYNWAEAGKKKMSATALLLKESRFIGAGKTTYKEEFVTAGGVDLTEIDDETCESAKWQGVFFAGEVMDVDGVTGGFNFQAAWSTAAVAAKNLVKLF